MAIKYYCDRCGSECNERFIIEITKGSTGFQYERLDLCETCKTGLKLYLKRYGNCDAQMDKEVADDKKQPEEAPGE